MKTPPSSILALSVSFLLILLDVSTIIASSIPPEALPTKSGYLKVNSTTGSSIFYAFYEAQQPTLSLSQTPLLIWLQGGPGCSSMIGNFYELGPWRVNHKIELEPNPGAWNRLFGLLFLDNPVGTGFSVAASPDEIPRNQYDVAKHLFTAIKSFVALDKQLFGARPIYITGESYAGKYAPAIGYYIVRKNSELLKEERVNLAGVAIGNGLTDPVTQLNTHAVNAYFSGLITEKQKLELEVAQGEVVKLVGERKWSEATNARTQVFNRLQNMTGFATLYDIRRIIPYETDLVEQFLGSVDVKKSLGVANASTIWEHCSDVVKETLHEDMLKSVKYMLEVLIKESKVLLYQGQCDMRVGVVSVEAFMKTLNWEGIEKFLASERKVWKVKEVLAGYVQKWGSLTHVVVLDAGHFVPTDQAVHSQAMIEDWVLERGYFANDKTQIQTTETTNLIQDIDFMLDAESF